MVILKPPSMRWQGLGVVVLGLALVLLWLLVGRPRSVEPQPGSVQGSAAGATEMDGNLATPQAPSRRTLLPLEPLHAAQGDLRIRFRARAQDGGWDSNADGRVVVYWNRTHKWGKRSLDIVRGVASLHPKLPREAPREWLEFDHVRLGGRRAVAVGVPKVCPVGGELIVDCEYVPGSTLIVHEGPDQRLGTDLQLAMASDYAEENQFVPTHRAPGAPAGRMGSGLTSPITLEDQGGIKVYFVRSPRSAWSRVAIDHEVPSERVVHLHPGGRAEFTVHAGSVHPRTGLWVYAPGQDVDRPSRPIAACSLDEGGRGFIEGLPVGAWEVRAEVGSLASARPVLGRRAFSVSANGVTHVELSLVDPPVLHAPVRVHGVIFLPEPIEDEACALVLMPEDPWVPEFGGLKMVSFSQMRPDPNDATRLTWDAGLLSPGTWKAEIHSVQWCETWSIEPGRENEFLVDLFELRSAWIEVVDRDSRAPVPIQEVLYWRTDLSTCTPGTASVRPLPGGPAGVFRLQALEGSYRFEIEGRQAGQHAVLETPTLAPRAGVLVAECSGTPHALLSLTLETRGTPVPVPLDWWRSLEFVTEDGLQARASESSVQGHGDSSFCTTAVLTFVDGGALEVRFPKADGFEELDPIRVELVPGETLDLTVELDPGS